MARKIAIVHGSFACERGAERLVRVLLETFPEADLYTFFDAPMLGSIANRTYFSVLNKIPFIRHIYKLTLPWWPSVYETFDLQGYDFVISSATDFAKGVLTTPNTRHISIIYTPTRYLWAERSAYVRSRLSGLFAPLTARLRLIDFMFAMRPDRIIAISSLSARRVTKQYRREVHRIVHPPVDLQRLVKAGEGGKEDGDFQIRGVSLKSGEYMVMSAPFQRYKRLDLAVKLALRTHTRLVIFGRGRVPSDYRRLVKVATSKGLFVNLGYLDEDSKLRLMRNASALVQTGIEDFGISVVEAISQGCPVLVNIASGGAEIVRDGINGFSVESCMSNWIEALKKVDKKKWDYREMLGTVKRYDISEFKKAFEELIAE